MLYKDVFPLSKASRRTELQTVLTLIRLLLQSDRTVCQNPHNHDYIISDNSTSLWLQEGTSGWFVSIYPLPHQRLAAAQEVPGSLKWHHICLRLPRNVQTGLIKAFSVLENLFKISDERHV